MCKGQVTSSASTRIYVLFTRVPKAYKLFSDHSLPLKPKELFKKTYLPNGYIDIVKTKNILNNILHGRKVLPFITELNLDIDSIEDYRYAKYKMEKN